MQTIKSIQDKANTIRKYTVESIGKLGVGHVGGCLSISDVLAVLYFHTMNIKPEDPQYPDRDRFVLSKGHGGPALYSTLALAGYFDKKELDTLNRPNTNLPSHCDRLRTIGVDMTTGSLGQGFSCAVGLAIGAKMDNKDYNVYTIIGDGESQEGQIWEAAMLAGSRKLNNLIAFTDYNDMQIDGTIGDINSLYPLDKKWEAFGFFTQTIDGHDIEAIIDSIEKAQHVKDKPSMIILKTIKGKGVSFSEGKVTSHNMPVTEEMWKTALEELEQEG